MGTVYLLDLSVSPTNGSAITNTPSDSEALGNSPYSPIGNKEPLLPMTLRKYVFVIIIIKQNNNFTQIYIHYFHLTLTPVNYF